MKANGAAPHTTRAQARNEQFGTGDRPARIRAYSSSQCRVFNHRNNPILPRRLAAFDELIDALTTKHQTIRPAADQVARTVNLEPLSVWSGEMNRSSIKPSSMLAMNDCETA